MQRRGLNPDVITEAAVALLDEVGLTELSTRRLAAKLGVQSPTLYWHVKNKAELLDLVAEAVCATPPAVDQEQPWRARAMHLLRHLRARLAEHRDAAALLRERPPGPNRRAQLGALVDVVASAGFSPTDARAGVRLLVAHTLDAVDDPDQFELGAEVILDGLARRLPR